MSFLDSAVAAARLAGAIQKENFETELTVGALYQYDIKLELDVRCQKAITERLLADFPTHAVLGEEGNAGTPGSEYEWIVDPIDGTVNYFYGIPHFCSSIALRHRGEIILGVIYDPMLDELFTVEKGGVPQRNGRSIRVSSRDKLSDAVVTLGFSKSAASIQAGGERYLRLAHQVRKTRLLGSAALAMAYVACGRLDAYIEESISLWDIAAGWLLVETAGGKVEIRGDVNAERFSITVSNGRLSGLE